MRDFCLSRSFLFLLLIVCAPVSVSAQSRTSSALRGTVLRTDGTPIVGAGVMINDYLAGTEEVEGQFDYVRFSEIDTVADCSS